MRQGQDGPTQHSYWSSNCQACSIKAECTTGKEGRVTRWEHEAIIEAMEARLGRHLTEGAFLICLFKYFRRQPVLSRDDIDSDAAEFISGSEVVRSLVYEIKTERGWIVGIRSNRET